MPLEPYYCVKCIHKLFVNATHDSWSDRSQTRRGCVIVNVASASASKCPPTGCTLPVAFVSPYESILVTMPWGQLIMDRYRGPHRRKYPYHFASTGLSHIYIKKNTPNVCSAFKSCAFASSSDIYKKPELVFSPQFHRLFRCFTEWHIWIECYIYDYIDVYVKTPICMRTSRFYSLLLLLFYSDK